MAIIAEDASRGESLVELEPSPFSTVEEAVEAIGRGEMVIVVDDPGRENEGDFVMAADLVTPEAVNFMTTHGRGIVCMPVLPERAGALGLNLLPRRGDYDGCAFTTSIDLARMAGRGPAGVICEIMAADGTMARLDDLVDVAALHGLHLITIADLIAHREARA